MKAPLLALALLIAATLAFVPQDPQQPAEPPQEQSTVISLAEMQYVDRQGETRSVPSRNVVEIRVFEDDSDHIRLELLYDNGDYSLIDAQALHILRSGGSTRDVKLVRASRRNMRFPRLP